VAGNNFHSARSVYLMPCLIPSFRSLFATWNELTLAVSPRTSRVIESLKAYGGGST